MRFLHTSDWHLGRSMAGHSRREEQEAFLDWFVELAKDRSVDAVVVAGDVYDRTVPSEDSVRMLNAVLTRLRRICPVVMIPGNHDQAVRLGFAAELLEDVDVHIRYLLEHSTVPARIRGADGVMVNFFGLPYLDPDLERHALEAERSHQDVLTKAMDRIRAHVATVDGRSVVVAHAFITGGLPSDSERDIRVGGVGDAPASVFHGVDYVALGHLHGAQTVATHDELVVAYSGSPLAYSFSEERHTKSVTLVEIPESGPVTMTRIDTPVRYPLKTVSGTIEQLLHDADHEEHRESWVRIRYTDERAVPNALGLLSARFARIAEFEHRPPRRDVDLTAIDPLAHPQPDDPVVVLASFFEYATGTIASPAEATLLGDVHEVARGRVDR